MALRGHIRQQNSLPLNLLTYAIDMLKQFIALINKENITLFLKIFIPTLIIVLAVAFQPWHEPKIFLRDINIGVYTGLLSNIGAFFWNSAAVICFLGACYAKKFKTKETFQFLRFAGCFSLFLMIDDFFMIHDRVLPRHLNWPEEIMYIGYIFGVIYYLYLYLKMKNLFYAPLLLSAFGFLGLGFIGDILGLGYVEEDGSKFIGISLWLAFHSVSTWALLKEDR